MPRLYPQHHPGCSVYQKNVVLRYAYSIKWLLFVVSIVGNKSLCVAEWYVYSDLCKAWDTQLHKPRQRFQRFKVLHRPIPDSNSGIWRGRGTNSPCFLCWRFSREKGSSTHVSFSRTNKPFSIPWPCCPLWEPHCADSLPSCLCSLTIEALMVCV